ncbi:hypothetical protein [Ralstonia flaminis]|jgi:hypothetical protein|uniref:Uncharacterized protein n=1 Tax=Ralstonia flaminis TaxID=3058597 RepID=A0ABM9K2B1_9RALS|nr:hypothetical protein [Ralstonia sp. LMG 18101]CAJ0811077.1 hypothetical protein LMG18101_01115 [Ralstonia sp. LMG 18101]
MLLSSLVPHLLPPSPAAAPRVAATPAAAPARQYVCLRVTVPSDAPHAVRRQLHALLGDALGLYIVQHDARRHTISVDLELVHADVDAVMGALLRGLPRATLGRITPLKRGHAHLLH